MPIAPKGRNGGKLARVVMSEGAIIEEQDLVAASRDGDVQAFDQLVLRYQQMVYNLAYRMLSDPESAADVSQDAFLSAFKELRKFRGGSFKSWILRITANACYDVLRRKQRRPTSSLDAMLEDEDSPACFPNQGEGPEAAALRRELLEGVKDGLLTLPPEQRLVVILSDVQGLAYEEIAQITNSSLGTVKSRLSRGRVRLRDFLLRQPELLPSQFRPDSR
ncbi:MAG: sigma-70 family RNA polymerase sigma factor [Chloroflexi bacterium]|nr:sigma-70 family RNA polymerase sigma factor [Chloroflexota bacterium]